MKEIFIQYASYNKWANDKILEVVSKLPVNLFEKQVESSFGSLRLTILHIWNAESIWWQRLNLVENIVVIPVDDALPMEAIFDGWKKQYSELNEWVLGVKEMYLNHVFAYRNSKREEFKQPVWQVLFHMFNHEMYHRGQIVNMLRQLGIDKIPATDFIVWSRNRK